MNKLIQRIKDYFTEEVPEPLTCSKCGKDELYIACPDHCFDCYIKYEVTPNNKDGWGKVENKSAGEVSWTEYTKHDGTVFTIYNMITEPGFSGATLPLAKEEDFTNPK